MGGDPRLVELKAKYLSLRTKILCFTIYCICCECLGIIAGLMELIIDSSANVSSLKALRITRAFKMFSGVVLIDTIIILVVLIILYKSVKKGDVKRLRICRIGLSVIFVI